MTTSTSSKPPVFQASLFLDRIHVKATVKAVLGTILFQRVLGQLSPSSFDFLGISFPVPGDAEIEALIDSKAEAFTRLVLDGTANGEGRSAKLFVAFYPVPIPPLAIRTTSSRTASPAPSSHSAASPARVRDASNTRRSSLATPVSTAFNWLARTALGGDPAGTEAEPTREQDEELKWAKEMDRNGKGMWEGYSIEIEVLRDGRRGGLDGEEKLRSQLNDFLLRNLSFVMHKTSHVPPITSSELMPFGTLILLDPATAPFSVPKPVVSEVKGFPMLHKALVAGTTTRSAERTAKAW
ncbi:uncharacterized protein JCM15063_000992 [Sporobolomyces koalae]|uniref:uncharacterized protein n=1 Tax=Sporobolomyces koalae TaxID=500713 RepID=UPI00317FF065